MKRLLRSICILCFAIIMYCTPSAEAAEIVTLQQTNAKDVYTYILTENLKQGFILQSISDYCLVFEDIRIKTLPFTVNWGHDSKVLLVYNIAPMDENAVVSCEFQIISNPGTEGEKIHIASLENSNLYPPPYKEDLKAGSQFTKTSLRSIKAVFNGTYLYGFHYILKQKELLVLKVWPDMPAEKAGLLAGDIIIKINGFDLTTLEDDRINNLLLTGEAGAKIQLTVLRNGQEINLKMTKKFVPPTFLK
ncbi:MAG: C-terminal peptidase (prc) [Firmicutes bacterium]|nr:C-terminal peptidase (prc) [Bacillota bacterium]